MYAHMIVIKNRRELSGIQKYQDFAKYLFLSYFFHGNKKITYTQNQKGTTEITWTHNEDFKRCFDGEMVSSFSGWINYD